ncbi:MAG: FAD:protein FMN transferase [Clostridia bacterium]|nr:FAD:protein FMN transferase [Clostridia bacterium]
MDYFDTVITIVGYENTKEEFDAVADDILSQFAMYHKMYSIYHRFEGMENLCTINELSDGKHRTVKVDRPIIDMLLYAKEMYTRTNGTVNIAMGSVLSLWHDYREIGMDNPAEASLPPMEKLKLASEHTDISKMIIDEKNCTVTLTDPLMKLDVGAIAKGYATERVASSFEERGVSGYLLNVGGNIRAIGTKPDNSPWNVGIENPNGDEYLAYLDIYGSESVVTSGSYQRYYYVDGKPYHHIIDPDTLMPSEGFVSVSVICEDSGLGDALSTALFCMSQEEGLALVESVDDAEAMWTRDDGTKTVSSGWNKYVKQTE